jgi:hypothetical protein
MTAASGAAGKGVDAMAKKPEDEKTEGKRQEYEKPEVRTEEVFETLAATCTKASSLACQTGVGFQGFRS